MSNWIFNFEVREIEIGLNHLQHQQGGANFKRKCSFRHIRIANDHVHPAKTRGIPVRFVASINDRTRPSGGRRNALPDLIRTLREHETRWRIRFLWSNHTGTTNKLPSD